MSRSEGENGTGRGHGTSPVPSTRAGTLWVALGVGFVLLVVVLVFVMENLHSVRASFFGAHWDLPLGVDILLGALLGGAVVLLFGAVRIIQLRRLARRHHRARLAAEEANASASRDEAELNAHSSHPQSTAPA